MGGWEIGLRFSRALRLECCKEKEIIKPPGSTWFPVLLPPFTYILGPRYPEWLLFQVSSRVFTEGEPLALRCHGWKNKLVYNVLFYQNSKAFKFSPCNSEFTILKTNLSHNGIYHCSGMGRHRYISAGVSVTVKGMVSEYA